MKFAHISDTHLGFRQYGIYERETDFYRMFEKVVSKIVSERPDFVLHSGDLFDAPKPPPRALWVAQRCFSKLREKGIPVYAITGNHDMLMRRGAMPPQVLFRDLGVRLLTDEEPFVEHKGTLICGVPYFSRHYSDVLKETLSTLSRKADKYAKSIIMIHQGTDRHMPKGFEIDMNSVPKNFSYYAMGHLHARITESYGKGKLVYPGSTELWSLNEYDDYKRNGKGFTLVDMHGDVPYVQNVTLELEREIIKQRLDAGKLEERLNMLREKLATLTKKPLLYLDVREGGFERSTLHDMLASKISDIVLSMRLSYISREDGGKVELKRTFDLPQIDDIIMEIMKDRKKAELAGALFRSLSVGNDEQARGEAGAFYESMGGSK